MVQPKQLSTAELRARLRPQQVIDQINMVCQWLLIGYRPVFPPPPVDPENPHNLTPMQQPPAEWVELSKSDINRFTVFLNQQTRHLSKLLPDLKAMELTDSTQRSQLSLEEIASRVASMHNITQMMEEKRNGGKDGKESPSVSFSSNQGSVPGSPSWH